MEGWDDPSDRPSPCSIRSCKVSSRLGVHLSSPPPHHHHRLSPGKANLAFNKPALGTRNHHFDPPPSPLQLGMATWRAAFPTCSNAQYRSRPRPIHPHVQRLNGFLHLARLPTTRRPMMTGPCEPLAPYGFHRHACLPSYLAEVNLETTTGSRPISLDPFSYYYRVWFPMFRTYRPARAGSCACQHRARRRLVSCLPLLKCSTMSSLFGTTSLDFTTCSPPPTISLIWVFFLF